MSIKKDLKGQKFGRLTVSQRASKFDWHCVCDCGNESVVRCYKLLSGKTKSCGCWRRETCARMGQATTHGESLTRLYRCWSSMLTRCNNERRHAFDRYGGRGIKVCERWHTYENFRADMGPMPPKLTLDRIDNDRRYEPDNCRWATRKQQANNRNKPKPYKPRKRKLIEIDGRSHTLGEWLELSGAKRSTYYLRRSKGMAHRDAFGLK